EEQRKPGRQFKIRQSNFAIGRSAPTRRSSMNGPIEEFRTAEHRSHDLFDSKIEAASVFSADFIERHEAIHIFRGHRTAERPARQILSNFPGACGLARGIHLRLRPTLEVSRC